MTIMTSLLVLLAVAAVGFFGSRFVYKIDTRIEEAKRNAVELSGTLRSYGLSILPKFLMDFAVGDKSSYVSTVLNAVQLLNGNPDIVLKEFDDVFDKVLTRKLLTEPGRIVVAAKLAEAVEVTDPSIVAKAPRAVVQ